MIVNIENKRRFYFSSRLPEKVEAVIVIADNDKIERSPIQSGHCRFIISRRKSPGDTGGFFPEIFGRFKIEKIAHIFLSNSFEL